MGVAENKALVRRFYEEVWDRGNFEFANDVFADDYVRHDPVPHMRFRARRYGEDRG